MVDLIREFLFWKIVPVLLVIALICEVVKLAATIYVLVKS